MARSDRFRMTIRQIGGFLVVGTIGFCTDALVLTVMSVQAGMNVHLARLLSFASAVSVTWYLNSKFTFARKLTTGDKGGEYTKYLLVQLLGACINLGVFSLLIALFPQLKATPVWPLAIGSLVAMTFNFIGSKKWAFSSR